VPRTEPALQPRLTLGGSGRGFGRKLFLCLAAVGIAWFFQAGIAGLGWIPTSSMEASLQRGDLVVITRGPYQQAHSFGRLLRRQGYGAIQRHDILVIEPPPATPRWTHPPGVGPRPLGSLSTSDLVKRVVGLPGDTVDVQGSALFINGRSEPHPSTLKEYWILNEPVESHRLALLQMGIPDIRDRGADVIAGPATANQMALLQTRGVIQGAERCSACSSITGRWIVPQKGVPVRPRGRAEAERLAWLIRTYEHQAASVNPAGHLVVNGHPVSGYPFRETYLFLAGDNRPQSTDSRETGPIPISLIRGKVVRVAVSWNEIRRTFRTDRFWTAPKGK